MQYLTSKSGETIPHDRKLGINGNFGRFCLINDPTSVQRHLLLDKERPLSPQRRTIAYVRLVTTHLEAYRSNLYSFECRVEHHCLLRIEREYQFNVSPPLQRHLYVTIKPVMQNLGRTRALTLGAQPKEIIPTRDSDWGTSVPTKQTRATTLSR